MKNTLTETHGGITRREFIRLSALTGAAVGLSAVPRGVEQIATLCRVVPNILRSLAFGIGNKDTSIDLTNLSAIEATEFSSTGALSGELHFVGTNAGEVLNTSLAALYNPTRQYGVYASKPDLDTNLKIAATNNPNIMVFALSDKIHVATLEFFNETEPSVGGGTKVLSLGKQLVVLKNLNDSWQVQNTFPWEELPLTDEGKAQGFPINSRSVPENFALDENNNLIMVFGVGDKTGGKLKSIPVQRARGAIEINALSGEITPLKIK